MMWFLGAVVVLAGLWFSHRYAWWAPAVDDGHPRILMYHMISEHQASARFNGLRVPPSMFERQLRWLRDRGWHFATMAEVMATPQGLPERTVVITFDDGYRDNFTNALPLLEKYQACATLYLVVDRFDNDWSTKKKAHHDSGELMREQKLSDADVEALIASGRIEIGGHTLTHANLNSLDEEQKRAEIAGCKHALEARFKTPVKSFAYPFGIYSARDAEIAAESGFDNGVLAEGGIETDVASRPMTLRRVKISGKENFLAFRMRMKCGRRGLKK